MKTILNLLLAGIVAAFCCSIGNAQIIYSNNFALGGAVNISNTPPTVANSYAGGANTATWNDVAGINDTGSLLANGTDNTTLGTSWLLPFTPQSHYVYLATYNVTFTNNLNTWIALGFAQFNPTNLSGGGRYADPAINGYDFIIANPSGANEQSFYGPRATPAIGLASANVINATGTWTVQIILNTLGSQWTTAFFVNGAQFGSSYTYASIPPIAAVGMSQNQPETPIGAVQYNNFALTTTLQPFIIQQPTPAETLSSGQLYTNIVAVVADPNGGTLSYQWYANGVSLANGGPISGANTKVLTINPISTADQFTNYYVIVTNNYGSVTSSLAGVTVLTNPVVTTPIASTNEVTLFGGTNILGTNYLGSSPTFGVTASGAPPIIYQWLTNGVVVGGATNASLTFTISQFGGPTNFTCVVTNGFGAVSNTWSATYVQAPLAPYPQAVLASQPLDFWRLDEPDNGLNNGNAGVICHDYQTGNNGIYTNVVLGQAGYNSLEPTETSAAFADYSALYSYAGHIHGVDFAVTNGGNAEFTVEAWAVGFGDVPGSPIVSEGTYGVNEEFGLGSDTNTTTMYQFYVRAANGTVYKADSAIPVNDLIWHHLVGICDEANGNVSLYVDGSLAASTVIPVKSGIYEASSPLAIGAGIISGKNDYTLEFNGNISDVAAYPYALSIGQVISHYASFGLTVPVSFDPPPPPTNVAYLANQTLAIPATISGSGPLGYYWTNLTAGGVVGSGQTSANGSLDATLTIPNVSANLSGDQLELVVTNGISSTNWFVTLFSPAPPITLDYSNPILYSNDFNGGVWSIAGMPLTAANSLVGGTNSTWVDALGTNDTGMMQANGVSTCTQGNSWLVPFTPQSGYVYTETASLTFYGYPGSWVGLGFAQYIPNNATVNGSFNTTAVNGYDFMILTESSANVQGFNGPRATGQLFSDNSFYAPGATNHTMEIVLDTTAARWVTSMYVDGVLAKTATYSSNPLISGVGITQNAIGAPYNIQWNSFALSQEAPGGVPPYVLNPLPPTGILLTNGTVTIPATVYGSAPLGYYWINNSTVLTSGTTNNMAPLPANLSVPGSSLSVGQLQLVVTNAYGTNITLVTLASPVNPNPAPIGATVTNNNLYLTWPTDHTGWTLQAQTNTLSVGLSTNWVDITGSTSTNQVVIPINPTNGSVFYRLILP